MSYSKSRETSKKTGSYSGVSETVSKNSKNYPSVSIVQKVGGEEELQMKKNALQFAGKEEELQMKSEAAQFAGKEEELQMKSDTTQLVGKEEELQMKSETTQFAGKEEELQMKSDTAQLAGKEEELQMKSETTQFAGKEEELQMKSDTTQFASPEEEIQKKEAPIQRKENKTGMPDNLKSGIENLSGMDMSDVKVHYNSSQPAQLSALAYAQGNDIHIGPGQEKHLPHEAWHVVQQRQGRVQATKQMKMGVAVNDDPGLEHEADVMGAKALDQVKETVQRMVEKKNQNHSHTPIIQAISLSSHGLSAGLEEGNDENLFATNGPLKGRIYYAKDAGATNRDGALRQATNIVSTVGQRTEKAGAFISDRSLQQFFCDINDNSRYKKGEWFTKGAPIFDNEYGDVGLFTKKDFNNKFVATHKNFTREDMENIREESDFAPLLDPFHLHLSIRYDGRYIGSLLNAKVEYGPGFNGYMYSVEDDDKGVNAQMTSRKHLSIDPEDKGIPNSYSQTHHTEPGPLGGLIDNIGPGNSKRDNEVGIDAYTLVIAEGARWQCVASLGSKVNNYTKFYYKPDKNKEEWHYLTFENLWANWKAFDCKFSIPDNKVIEVMKGGLAELVKKTQDEPSGDYDLE